MLRIIFISTIFYFVLSINLPAQNTVGLLSYNPSKAFEGYNLIFPHNQPNVYLLNNCGEIVHVWEDDPQFRPGNSVYLLENGNLVKCKHPLVSENESIGAGGKGGIVEIVDWDNTVLWSFEQSDSTARLHHDIQPMPNGHILMISWEYKSKAEAIQAGRDTALLINNKLWPDYILEVDPNTDEIVWEWHVWDHLIQDYDAGKDNFGSVGDHPELIDLNWTSNPDGIADWLHTNAIDYNPELDQIVVSVPFFDEIWIIDHSTSVSEAAGHTSGLSGKGGDLIFRWGNPAAYRMGNAADQKLFFQHDIHWIDEFVDFDHPHYGKLAVFNNRVNPSYSTANIINPGFGWDSWAYLWNGSQWGPEDFELTVMHPQPTKIHSGGLSSVQLLPNDNLLICSGANGYSVELTPQNDIVWEYKTPLMGGQPVTQGDTTISGNITFRIKRYPTSYAAFEGRDLTPIGYIELDPDTTFCDMILPVDEVAGNTNTFKVFPNPASGIVTLEIDNPGSRLIEIIDLLGRRQLYFEMNDHRIDLDVSNWEPGIFFIRMDGFTFQKLLVIN